MTAATSSNPRWKQILTENLGRYIKEDKSVLYYALSTVSVPATCAPVPQPQVRYIVHRGFVNEAHAVGSPTPTPTGVEVVQEGFGSNEVLVATTDVRTAKVKQLVDSAEQKAKRGGGDAGGEASIAWWMEGPQYQFRITGAMHVLPTAGHPLRALFPFDRLSPPSSGERGGEAKFDWDRERRRIFERMSPALLASFARPVPGTPHPFETRAPPDEAPLKGKPTRPPPGGEPTEPLNEAAPKSATSCPWPLELPNPREEHVSKEEREWLDEAERNFALLVLEPKGVDLLELADVCRTKWRLVERDGGREWIEWRVVP